MNGERRVLELGCGRTPLPESSIRHDLVKHSDFVDIAHDLDNVPWPWESASMAKIIGIDVMEHLKLEIADWLDECWRILEPDGLLIIQVPHGKSWTALADPTHRRVFHEITFDYWDKESEWHKHYGSIYFGDANRWWTVASKHVKSEPSRYGDIVSLQFVLKKAG